MLLLTVPAFALRAGPIGVEFENVDDFTDFSVSGLSESKTLSIFQSELESELDRFARLYLKEGQTLEIIFTDVDMAGDIQPWRNRHNADIRYVERIYPPRLEFRYVLKNSEGEVLSEGEESITDLAFDFNVIAPMRSRHMTFFYELDLLGNWIRKTIRSVDTKPVEN